jgi:hypothetical protein
MRWHTVAPEPHLHFHPPNGAARIRGGVPGRRGDVPPEKPQMSTRYMRTVTVNGVEYIDLLYMVLYQLWPQDLNVGRRYGDHVADHEHVHPGAMNTMLIECVYFGAQRRNVETSRRCMIDGETLNVYVV